MSSQNQPQNEQELKEMVINSLPEPCKKIGTDFFDCLEVKAKDVQEKLQSEKQFEEYMTNTAIPKCLSEFNLEECLVKNQKP